MKTPIRFAILGPGKIAHKFADAFHSVPSAQLYAVASRDTARSEEFAAKWKIPVIHNSYDALVRDPNVDIVYIATPHPFHHEQSLLCLNHRKAVLCEKPLTMSFKQASDLVTASRENKTFLMEGMWSRFFPATIKTLELIRSNAIGDVKYMRADFGFAAPFNPEGRVFNLALGGGAQLDVGVYTMFLTLLFLGKPAKIQAAVTRSSTGADETAAVQLTFPNGCIAHFMSSIVAFTPQQADIVGTTGYITMTTPAHKSQLITITRRDMPVERFEFPFTGFGFEYQLAHVTECMTKGLTESPLMPHSLSLLMAETADEILRQGGIVYPESA